MREKHLHAALGGEILRFRRLATRLRFSRNVLIVGRTPYHEMRAELDVELLARPAPQQTVTADHRALRVAGEF